MYSEEKIYIGQTDEGGKLYLLPKMANRHGLVAGATGTGKTITLKVLAESFSDMGVPVFLADVKGDIAGMAQAGNMTEDMQKRVQRFGLADTGFQMKGAPVTIWDIFGERGIPLRTTISEMGPLLLARIMDLNDLQSDILSIIFKIADDQDLLLVDTKDLKAILNYVADNNKEFAMDYGNISKVSIAAILRAVVALEINGGDRFFGEPALRIADWFQVSPEGKGMIQILDSSSLINNGVLYSTFLLWLLSELFETLPEVGDSAKPRMVFFFDEAHLLFNGASKTLLDKIEQVVKLIRSKGIGIYFCTQNPRDIPDGVLSQLGNKIQHALHAYTPSDQKAVKAAAASFRDNPAFNTYETILSLGIGEALVSFLDESGIPTMAEKANILPPQCSMGSLDDMTRERLIKESMLFIKYYEAYDPDSAYEFLTRRGLEKQAEEEKAAEEAAKAKQEEKEAKERAKQEEKEAKEEAKRLEREERERIKQEERVAREKERAEKAEARKKASAVKSVGNTVVGTVGRQVGKSVGGKFGSFGKTLGGNVGASLGRGILSTLFKF
ncbi:MAG: DUF853 domain-containing protein [Lachnospiraceae bacterium]|nr:DUF853 domain-containing protein [Lachnospiraceae bacterium]